MDNIPFQIFAWTASLVFAAESLLVKFVSRHKINNPWLFNFIWLVFVLIINSAVCLYMGAGLPEAWSNILWAGLFFAIGMSLYNLVAYQLDVSSFVPLSNFHAIFAVLLGVFILGETLTLKQFGLIVLMIVASFFVILDERFSVKSFFTKGVALNMIEVAALALMSMFLKKAAVENDFWTLNLWYYLIGGIIIFLTWPFFSKEIKNLNKDQISSVLILAVAGVVGNLLATKAYLVNISISQMIISLPLSVIAVMILSPFFPKLFEHHTWKIYLLRIMAAAILVYAGIKLI